MGEKTGSAATELRFDRSVYSLEAIKRAAYEVMSSLRIDIHTSDSEIVCTLRPAKADLELEDSLRAFEREVLDQDLRITLEASTEPVRSAILGLAFSRTGLQDG